MQGMATNTPLSKELWVNDCPEMKGGVHQWVYLGNEDALIDTYKCERCHKNVYEQLRPFGSLEI